MRRWIPCIVLPSALFLTLGLTGCNGCGSSSLESVSGSADSFTGSSNTVLSVNKMGGDITVTDAPGGASLKTMGGNITVNKVEASLDATSMGGNVSVLSADVATLKAKTMGGTIDISSTRAGDLQADTAGGNITVQTLGDGSISLKSLGGNIQLTIPKSASAQIDIELVYTRTSSQNFTITSNLNLAQQTTPNWDFSHGDPRKTITATGSVNGGKNHILIKTVGGNVTLNAQ